jgi:hypothetical protein
MSEIAFDSEGEPIDSTGTRPKYIDDQFCECVRRLTNIVQRAMTGSAYPILKFSTEAQLFFDPISERWTSDTTPYEYSTPEVVKYGGIVKANSDLMVPLWEHLWTEKSDFRKSEMFRTNESIIRMVEKESEKLIDISNEYKADMRTVRENVFRIESDLKSKVSEITSFRDSMGRLGLLSEATMQSISDDRLAEIMATEDAAGRADKLETLLRGLPKAQAELRTTVNDPVELIKESSMLVSYEGTAERRLLTN